MKVDCNLTQFGHIWRLKRRRKKTVVGGLIKTANAAILDRWKGFFFFFFSLPKREELTFASFSQSFFDVSFGNVDWRTLLMGWLKHVRLQYLGWSRSFRLGSVKAIREAKIWAIIDESKNPKGWSSDHTRRKICRLGVRVLARSLSLCS